MRLIDADALKEAVNNKNIVGRFNMLRLIDTAPTIDEYTSFAIFVARNVLDDDFKDDADCFAEIACRKLVKLGLVKLDEDRREYSLIEEKETDNETN